MLFLPAEKTIIHLRSAAILWDGWGDCNSCTIYLTEIYNKFVVSEPEFFAGCSYSWVQIMFFEMPFFIFDYLHLLHWKTKLS